MIDPADYTVLRLEELDRVPLAHGIWRPIRRAAGITAFGTRGWAREDGDLDSIRDDLP